MRTKKAGINAIVGVITYLMSFLPSLIVRKIFLNSLGEELLGLSSLYTNIIGVLSIVELGIGNAIIFSLYKPFAENDRVKIKGYLNYYSRFYKIVGIIILLLGFSILPLLNVLIKDTVNMSEARIYFILYLVNTFISYLFSYKICILNVAQENYIVSIAATISKLIIAVLQFITLKIYPNFYLYILIQIFINIIYYCTINLYIDKKFSWIKNVQGMITKNEEKALMKNIRALFMHKIGGTFVFGIDNIVVSRFLNLNIVGKFATYNMLVGAFQGVIGSAITAITSSIGNLIAEGNTDNTYSIHKKLFFANFWCVSFVIISLYNVLDQFIGLFFGVNQVLDKFTLALILANSYFFLMRSSVERFKEASGIYSQDKYSPLVEALINLVTSIILVNLIGLSGVVLGTLISNLAIVFWLKPKIVYKDVFKKPLIVYFKMYFKYLIIGLIPLLITSVLTANIKDVINLNSFIFNCCINTIIINMFYYLVFRKTEELKYFKNIIKSMLVNKGIIKLQKVKTSD